MNQLDKLENESIFIIREAYHAFGKIAALWSMGKDSNVMLHLIRKAFLGDIPFPALHIDTSYKMPEMIKFRDTMAKKWGIELIIGQNKKALDAGMNFQKGRLNCCTALKTNALIDAINKNEFDAIFVGIRSDEEGTRAKEHIFSKRSNNHQWDAKSQPIELGQFYLSTSLKQGEHMRVHPLLDWTELDIWQYIKREKIPVVPLYFAKNGTRYRSLGCLPCTTPIQSQAVDVDSIIIELQESHIAERDGRMQDQEKTHAFEELRESGYM